MSFIPSAPKSIQQVLCTFGGVSTDASATINAVALANSIIIPQGLFAGSNSGSYTPAAGVRCFLNSTTQVIARSAGIPRSGDYFRAIVIEFFPQFIKGFGASTIAIPNGSSSATATITAVNTAKTTVILAGGTFTSTLVLGGNLGDNLEVDTQPSIVLTNSTTITASWIWNPNNSKPQTRVVGYNYLEFR